MTDKIKEAAFRGIKLMLEDKSELADFLVEIAICMSHMERRLAFLEKISDKKDFSK